MIKINLLGETTVVDHTAKVILAGYVGSVLLFCLIFFGLNMSVNSNIEQLTGKNNELQARLDELKETTKEVRGLEAKKKELSEKLRIIATLKRNKIGPVRVMDDFNTALPDKAWVTNLKEQGGLLKIIGFALDNQTIAGFMKGLEASSYFETVELVQTKQTEKYGVKIAEFTLQTKVSYAGKAKKVSKPDEKIEPQNLAKDMATAASPKEEGVNS